MATCYPLAETRKITATVHEKQLVETALTEEAADVFHLHEGHLHLVDLLDDAWSDYVDQLA